MGRKNLINFFKLNSFLNYIFSSELQLTVMNTDSWFHISIISVPQPCWLMFYLLFICNMTFGMLGRYKVFTEAFFFKAYLTVKENDKIITYRND